MSKHDISKISSMASNTQNLETVFRVFQLQIDTQTLNKYKKDIFCASVCDWFGLSNVTFSAFVFGHLQRQQDVHIWHRWSSHDAKLVPKFLFSWCFLLMSSDCKCNRVTSETLMDFDFFFKVCKVTPQVPNVVHRNLVSGNCIGQSINGDHISAV